MNNPTVIFSMAGAYSDGVGDAQYDGVVKLINQWCSILNRFEIEAAVATESGEALPWLVNPAPHCTWDEALERWRTDGALKVITVGWDAVDVWTAADNLARSVYAYFPRVPPQSMWGFLNTHMGLIKQFAVPNRYVQAWFMTTFKFKPTLLIIPTDCTVFYPDPAVSQRHKIGFFHHPTAPEKVRYITDVMRQSGLQPEFTICKLDERAVAETLRQCGVFVGLNAGDDPLWGAPVSITHQEAMASGCVPILFDTLGNREYVLTGENGILIERDNMDAMARFLVYLYANPGMWPGLSNGAAYTIRARRSMPAAVPGLFQWLALEESQYAMPYL